MGDWESWWIFRSVSAGLPLVPLSSELKIKDLISTQDRSYGKPFTTSCLMDTTLDLLVLIGNKKNFRDRGDPRTHFDGWENSQLDVWGKHYQAQDTRGCFKNNEAKRTNGGNQCGVSFVFSEEFFILYRAAIDAISPTPVTEIKVTLALSPEKGWFGRNNAFNQCLLVEKFQPWIRIERIVYSTSIWLVHLSVCPLLVLCLIYISFPSSPHVCVWTHAPQIFPSTS